MLLKIQGKVQGNDSVSPFISEVNLHLFHEKREINHFPGTVISIGTNLKLSIAVEAPNTDLAKVVCKLIIAYPCTCRVKEFAMNLTYFPVVDISKYQSTIFQQHFHPRSSYPV